MGEHPNGLSPSHTAQLCTHSATKPEGRVAAPGVAQGLRGAASSLWVGDGALDHLRPLDSTRQETWHIFRATQHCPAGLRICSCAPARQRRPPRVQRVALSGDSQRACSKGTPPLPGACLQKSTKGGRQGLPTPGRRAGLRPEQSPPPRGCGLQGLQERTVLGPLPASLACGLPAPLPLAHPPLTPSPPAAAGWGRQRSCNNSCKCQGSGDKGRSGRRHGDPCRQTVSDVHCVPLTKVGI